MENKKKDKKDNNTEFPLPERRNTPSQEVPGINTPGIELPAFNPPVPNRAWTAMRAGLDIEQLSDEERRDLYIGRDGII